MPRKDRTPAWYRNRTPCPRCKLVHERCLAHRKSDGSPCGVRPITGATVCRVHGVNGRTRAKAAKQVAQAEVEAEVRGFLQTLGTPDPVDYLVALEELYLGKLQEVRVLRWAVAQKSETELTWGTVERSDKDAGQDVGHKETQRAGLSVLLVWMHKAEDQLAAILALCDRAGMTQKRKEYLDRVGSSVAAAMQAYAALMVGALVEAGFVGQPVEVLEAAAPALARKALLTLDVGQPTEGARV